MTVSVRELQKGEGVVWRDLRLRALMETPDFFGYTFEWAIRRTDGEWNDLIDRDADDPFTSNFVAELNQEAVGMAACTFDEKDKTICAVSAAWVRPDVRRRGVAKLLLNAALEWMERSGAKQASVGLPETNHPVIALFSSLGFVDTGKRRTLAEGLPEQVVVMTRNLGAG